MPDDLMYHIPLRGGPMDGEVHKTQQNPPQPVLHTTPRIDGPEVVYMLVQETVRTRVGYRVNYYYKVM